MWADNGGETRTILTAVTEERIHAGLLISFILEPGPVRKIFVYLGEPLKPLRILPACGPPTDQGELVQVHDDCRIFLKAADELRSINIYSLGRQPDATADLSSQAAEIVEPRM